MDLQYEIEEIESFILELQNKVSQLTLENDMLKQTIKDKNKTIHHLEYLVMTQPCLENKLNDEDVINQTNQTNQVHHIDRKQLEKQLINSGKFTHPRVVNQYMSQINH